MNSSGPQPSNDDDDDDEVEDLDLVPDTSSWLIGVTDASEDDRDVTEVAGELEHVDEIQSVH